MAAALVLVQVQVQALVLVQVVVVALALAVLAQHLVVVSLVAARQEVGVLVLTWVQAVVSARRAHCLRQARQVPRPPAVSDAARTLLCCHDAAAL